MKRRSKEQGDIFGLSFMDCICCGFGAVILMFVLTTRQEVISEGAFTNDVNADVDRAQALLSSESTLLAELEEKIEALESKIEQTQKELEDAEEEREILEEERTAAVAKVRQGSEETASLIQQRSESEAKVKEAEKILKEEKESAGSQQASGESISSFNGSEKRHYLTGMKVDGKRNVILVDTSASMLADRISAVSHFVPKDGKASSIVSRKWTRVLDTVDWLVANINYDDPDTEEEPGRYLQVIAFNEDVTPLLEDEVFDWVPVEDSATLQRMSSRLWNMVPEGGANLEAAVLKALELRPRPDNIYLLTDSLPTHSSAKPTGSRSTWDDRYEHFNPTYSLVRQNRLPVNVILFELDGDPWSAGHYWRLADSGDGSFFAPSPDWPN